MTEKIPYRQIHLDFHTSELIDGIAASFNPDVWAGTLKEAKVNSINLFAKCHHGMFYYPTKLGRQHPGLNGYDLLGAQIKALRSEGIRYCIYTTVAWCEDAAIKHPQWQVVDVNGVLGMRAPFQDRFVNWRFICLNKPDYRQLLKSEFVEQYELFKPAGFWIDIVYQGQCVCPDCLAGMKAMGFEPGDELSRKKYGQLVVVDFMREIYSFIKELSPELTVYFNSNQNDTDMADLPEYSSLEKRKYFDYLDVESLPSDGWGYTHFPIAASYIDKYEKEITMMNGKFHSQWGDFGSLRNLEALEYECFRAIAMGAKACVGDQMHPNGVLDPVVYGRIGKVFASIEEKEPWLTGSKKIRNVAILLPTPTLTNDGQLSVEGAYRVLCESRIPFDYINFLDDLSPYELLILPDSNMLTREMADKINAYTRAGGKLLATGKSGLLEGSFVLDAIEALYIGPSEHTPRYVRFEDGMFSSLPQIDTVMYAQGETVAPADGARVPARIVAPYFNRAYDRFCSHRQTPPLPYASEEPAILEGDSGIYISSPLFADYSQNGCSVHKDILFACIKKLIGRLPVECDLPDLSEVTLRENGKGIVVHTLSYAITRRCKLMDTINDAIELYNKTYKIMTEFKPSSVTVVPQGDKLDFIYEDGYTTYSVPYQKGHGMVFIEA